MSLRSSPKNLGRKEAALSGILIAGGKTAGEAPFLAEQIRLDPDGQDIEAEVGDPEHAPGRQQHAAG